MSVRSSIFGRATPPPEHSLQTSFSRHLPIFGEIFYKLEVVQRILSAFFTKLIQERSSGTCVLYMKQHLSLPPPLTKPKILLTYFCALFWKQIFLKLKAPTYYAQYISNVWAEMSMVWGSGGIYSVISSHHFILKLLTVQNNH